MFRRILLLLLVMILPLQAIAAVQMGLSACHAKDLGHFQAAKPSHEHAVAPHDHAQHDHSTADRPEHAGRATLDPCSNCTACDLCVPPLAFTTGLPEHDWSSSVVAGPMPSSNGVIPRAFDRPPRSVPLL